VWFPSREEELSVRPKEFSAPDPILRAREIFRVAQQQPPGSLDDLASSLVGP
jgi:hypothetical protein